VGSYWADPTLGSRLHLLQGRGITETLLREAHATVWEATRRFVTQGVAEAVEVTVTRASTNGIRIVLELVQGEQTQTFDFLWGTADAA